MQLQHRLVGIAIADMPQFRQLILQGLSQRRVSMAQGVHCDAARHIDILFPLLSQTREPAALTGINGAGAKQGTR